MLYVYNSMRGTYTMAYSAPCLNPKRAGPSQRKGHSND